MLTDVYHALESFAHVGKCRGLKSKTVRTEISAILGPN